jgi:hypothetical protein
VVAEVMEVNHGVLGGERNGGGIVECVCGGDGGQLQWFRKCVVWYCK